MTCAHVREELDLALGQAELPNEIAEHVHSCVDCTRYWHELNGMAQDWQRADLFKVNEIVLHQVESAIGASLRAQETPRIFNIPYRLQYGIAASIAVVGLALLALLYSPNPLQPENSQSAQVDSTGADTDLLYAMVDAMSLSDEELSALFEDVDTVTIYPTESSSWDDLISSQEELEYLKTAISNEDLI